MTALFAEQVDTYINQVVLRERIKNFLVVHSLPYICVFFKTELFLATFEKVLVYIDMLNF